MTPRRDSIWNKSSPILGLPGPFQPQKNFYKKQRGEKPTLMLSIRLRGKKREGKEELHTRTDTEALTLTTTRNSKKTKLLKR